MMWTKKEPESGSATPIASVYNAPVVQAAVGKRDELRRRLPQLEARILEADDRPRPGRIAEEAIALAGGVAVAPRIDLAHETAVTGRALTIAEGQLTDAIARASEPIVRAARPAHDAIMKRIGESLATLTEAVHEEDAMIRTLQAGGVVGVNDLGRPDAPTQTGDLFRRLRLLDFAEWKKRVQRLGVEL